MKTKITNSLPQPQHLPKSALALVVTSLLAAGCGSGRSQDTDFPGSVTIDEDQSVELRVATRADGSEIVVIKPPRHGLLKGAAPKYTYVPDTNFSGDDEIVIRFGPAGESATERSIAINVRALNDAPVAKPQALALDEDTVMDFTLTAFDIEGDALSVEVVTAPAKGSLSGNGTSYSYTPEVHASGEDFFEYRVSDGELQSEIVRVDLTIKPVNDAPVISGAMSVQVAPGKSVNLTLNTQDVDSKDVQLYVVDEPAHGRISIDGSNIAYEADPLYTGPESVTLIADDGETTSEPFTISLPAHRNELAHHVNDLVILDAHVFTLTPREGATFFWEQIDGAEVTLINGNSSAALFKAPAFSGSAHFAFKQSIDGVTSTILEKTVSFEAYPDVALANRPFSFSTHPFTVTDIASKDDIAYLALDEYGVIAVDTQNALKPELIGAWYGGNSSAQLALQNNSLYVFTYQKAVELDLSHPEQLEVVNEYELPGIYPEKITTHNNHITVVDNNNGVRVIHTSSADATNPIDEYNFANPSSLIDATYNQGLFYVSTGHSISVKHNDEEAAQTIIYADARQLFEGTHATDSHLIVTTGSRIQLYDLSVPASPAFVSEIDSGMYLTSDLKTVGDKLFVNSVYGGIVIIDISNPIEPEIVNNVNTAGLLSEFSTAGGKLYIVDNASGLRVVDPVDPLNRSWLNRQASAAHTFSIKRIGDYLYSSDENSFIHATSVTNVNQIIEESGTLIGFPYQLSRFEDVLVSANRWAGVNTFSLEDPAAPERVDYFKTTDARAAAFADDHVYIADGIDGLVVFDKNDPVPVATIAVDGYARGVAVLGNTAFLAAGSGDVYIFDVTDPGNPNLIKRLELDGWAEEVIVENDLLYVNANHGGLQIFDISDLANINLLGAFTHENIGNNSRHFHKHGDTIYWANNNAGLSLFDVSDPTNIRYSGQYELPDRTYDVDADSDFIYTANYYSGSYISDNIRPQLDQDYESVTAATVLTYQLTWNSVNALNVDCQTSGGRCVVTDIDPVNHTATLEWTTPDATGTYKLNAFVGNTQFFQTVRDSVTVE